MHGPMNVKFVKMDINETEYEGVACSGLAQDTDGLQTLANMATNVQVP